MIIPVLCVYKNEDLNYNYNNNVFGPKYFVFRISAFEIKLISTVSVQCV